MRLLSAIVAFAAILAVPVVHAEDPLDILIVANKLVPTQSLSIDQAKEIFLHKRVDLDGNALVPIAAPQGSRLRDEFCRLVLGMSPGEEQMYWQDRRIRVGDAAPPEFSSPLRAVFRLKSGVGYIRRGEYREGVAKILLVVPYVPTVKAAR